MKRTLLFVLMFALAAMVGCGSTSTNSNQNTSQTGSGSLFVTGEDAPLSSVVGFQLELQSVTLNGLSHTPTVVSDTTVDFARLIGLRSPLAFNSVPADTYNSATITVSNPVISYVDMTHNPPALNTINGTLPQAAATYQVTVQFPQAMVVDSNGLAGLKMEMDIRQSVTVNSSGQVSGAVTPVFYIKATKASDPDGLITDLEGGLVSVSGDSFVIQGPYGRQLTVDVSNSTNFNSGWSINNLAPPAFVSVQGTFQADGTLSATGVEVITTAHSFVSGRILQVVNNSSGDAQQVTMWVGETGADMVKDVDTIQTINISAVSDYEICFFDGALTQLLFNDTSLIVGQRVFVGGSYVSGVFTPQMISLRRQGVYGMFNPASVTVTNSPNGGTFTISNNGLAGYLTDGTVTVDTFNGTVFYNLTGLNQLQTTSTAIPIVARGLFLKNPLNNNAPTFFAGFVSDPPQATN